MKRIVGCMLSLTLISAATTDNAQPSLKSPGAVAAQRKHDAVVEKAADDYHRAIIAADKAYLADLDKVLEAAFQRKNASDVQEIDTEKKRIEVELKSLLALLPAGRSINLLASVVPEKDTVAGSWHFQDGALIGSGGRCTRLRLRYLPPEEYDFIIEFSRIAGTGSIQQIAVDNGHNVLWQLGAYDGHNCGFGLVSGQPSNVNATRNNIPLLVLGERHKCVVAVRKNGIAAYLDDRLVSQYRTSGADLSLPSDGSYDLGGPELGVAMYDASVAFRVIEVVEITGKGTMLRGN